MNAICQALVQCDLADSEQEWEREHKCTPPYVLVHFGPTVEYCFTGTHAKLDVSTVHTYRGFNGARVELQLWSQEVLPSVLAGLVSSFTRNDHPVKLQPVDSAFFGIMEDKRTVLDARLVGSGVAYASTSLTAEQVGEQLDSAGRVAGRVRPKVAKFFYLAQNEDDPLKRFLYFFLAIEIETHATFAEIDRSRMLLALLHPPAHAAAATQAFSESQNQKWTNLRDRFVWCVICAWPHLSEVDIELFKRLKRTRDDIAHGSLASPPQDAVINVELLSGRLQLALL